MATLTGFSILPISRQESLGIPHSEMNSIKEVLTDVSVTLTKIEKCITLLQQPTLDRRQFIKAHRPESELDTDAPVPEIDLGSHYQLQLQLIQSINSVNALLHNFPYDTDLPSETYNQIHALFDEIKSAVHSSIRGRLLSLVAATALQNRINDIFSRLSTLFDQIVATNADDLLCKKMYEVFDLLGSYKDHQTKKHVFNKAEKQDLVEKIDILFARTSECYGSLDDMEKRISDLSGWMEMLDDAREKITKTPSH